MKHIRSTFFLLTTLFIMASCGEDRSGEYYALIGENVWIEQIMKEHYLWYDSIPAIKETDYFAEPEDFLQKLVYTKAQNGKGDPYSYIEIKDASDAARSYLQRTSTYGFDFELMTDPTGISSHVFARILFVLPNSPASEAGLERGNWISAIGKEELTNNNYGYLMEGGNTTFARESLVFDEEGNSSWIATDTVKVAASRPVELNPFYIDTVYEAVQFDSKSDSYTKYIKYDHLDRKLNEKGEFVLTKEEEQKGDKEVPKRELTKMDKIILNQEQFKLKNPVQEINGKLALSLDDAKYAFNVRFDKSKDGKILKIYTIDFLEQQIARSLGKYSIDSNYQNRRSIIDGYAFLADNQSKERGVFQVNGGAISNNVIPIKYDDVRFAQNNSNVYCMQNTLIELKNLENGKTVIKAGEYASISVYSQEKQLYLVSDRTKKYGLVGIDGQIVIPTDFDIIGYDTSFYPSESEDAGKILFGNLIPVFKDNRWGFYYADSNKEVLIGQKLIGLGCKKMEYVEPGNGYQEKNEIELPKEIVEKLDKIGFKLQNNKIDKQVAFARGFTTNKSDIEQGESVFTIPESANNGYAGVVVRTEEGLYGIISSNAKKTGEFVLPPNFDRIYMLMQNGEAKYYAQSGSNIVELNRQGNNESNSRNTETTVPRRKNTAVPITDNQNTVTNVNQNEKITSNQNMNTNDNQNGVNITSASN